MLSSTLQIGIYATMGALGSLSNPTHATRTGATVMLTLYAMCLQFSWSPLFHAIVAEVPTQRLRDQTYAVGCICNIVTQWAFSFSIPYLLFKPHNLGPKIGYIFLGFSITSLLFAYFCIPECRGRTLEEIDQLFLEGTPVRKFRKARPTLFEDTDLEQTGKSAELGTVVTVHAEHATPRT